MMNAVLRSAIVAAALCVAATTRGSAQDASDWDTQAHTATRLIAGAAVKNADPEFLRAGVEIKLDPGWKTYWRDPGDSGVPPTLDFSGSENVKSVTVAWPAPERFPDGAGGNSIGYVDHLILPLRIVPADATKETSLHLKLDYAVCGNLCVPIEAKLALALNGDGAEEPALEKAEIRVPRRIALGSSKRDNGKALAVLAVHREPGDGHDRVVVDVDAPPGEPVDLFAEGPTPDWSLPLPQSVGDNGATRRFSFELDGLPPDAHTEGAMLTFTAVSADDAVEVVAHLD
jgi:DsbC/DsbD-like thiol-disulfide interchange protein